MTYEYEKSGENDPKTFRRLHTFPRHYIYTHSLHFSSSNTNCMERQTPGTQVSFGDFSTSNIINNTEKGAIQEKTHVPTYLTFSIHNTQAD